MKHILYILTALTLALFATACSDDNRRADEPQQGEQGNGSAVLSLRVAIADATSRAPEASSVEAMRQLQIVVLRPGGEVEVNYRADFGSQATAEYFGIFRLRPAEDKTIYAIANPASTGFDFDAFPAGSKGLDKALESYEYSFAPSLPIAMTDSREIAASKLVAGEYTEVQLNVVRVATKFTVEIVNNREEEVTLTGFSTSNLAERQFLMPHFTGSADRHIVYNQGLKGFDFDSMTGLHWSDWLRLAVDESQAYPSDETLADRRGWIMKYAVPDDASHAKRKFNVPPGAKIAKGATYTLPDHYFAESRSGLIENSLFGLGEASGEEQSYSYDISFKSVEGGEKTFENLVFPNLRALFRNTHVVLRVTVYQIRVISEVRVVPYLIIDLKPNFGWESLPDAETGDDRDPSISDPDRNPNLKPGGTPSTSPDAPGLDTPKS